MPPAVTSVPSTPQNDMSPDVEDLRAILAAYKQVVDASWSQLHPTMAEKSRQWGTRSAVELRAELADYVTDASRPSCNARLFWKLGPEFEFGGCNTQFAQDAGFTSTTDVVGITDFDKRLPWRPQSAKYRLDDEAVVASRIPQLDIIERQKAPNGDISWVRVGKVPIQRADGTAIGVLGMYEVLDAETGRTLHLAQPRRPAIKPDA
jgi:hypothetical protein